MKSVVHDQITLKLDELKKIGKMENDRNKAKASYAHYIVKVQGNERRDRTLVRCRPLRLC